MDWFRHVIDCNTHIGKPVTSAHHLVYATVAEVALADPQARFDWGLDKAAVVSPTSPRLLHQLYRGLIVESGITATRLHRWRTDGTLVWNIKAIYEVMPPEARGERYSWFLAHQYVFTNPFVTPAEDAKQQDSMDKRLWSLIGGDPLACLETIREFIGKFDENTRSCWELFRGLMDCTYPGPMSPSWLEFGFCACLTKRDEMRLFTAYKDLATICPFYVFRDAFVAGSLVSLFQQHKVPLSSSTAASSTLDCCLIDTLSLKPHQRRSVWWLKRLISIVPDNSEVDWRCPYPLDVEWGFVQCKNKKDTKGLMSLYKAFFSSPTSNPLELDMARRAGRLSQFLFDDIGIKVSRERQRRYKRWFSDLVVSPPSISKKAQDATWERLVDSFSPQRRRAFDVELQAAIVPVSARTLEGVTWHVLAQGTI